MQTKIILAIAAVTLVAAAAVGISVAQFVGAQTANQTIVPSAQFPNGQYVYGAPINVNGTIVYPCYPYLAYQNGTQVPQPQTQAPYAYGYGYGGMGMCGRFR